MSGATSSKFYWLPQGLKRRALLIDISIKWSKGITNERIGNGCSNHLKWFQILFELPWEKLQTDAVNIRTAQEQI